MDEKTNKNYKKNRYKNQCVQINIKKCNSSFCWSFSGFKLTKAVLIFFGLNSLLMFKYKSNNNNKINSNNYNDGYINVVII